MQFSDDDKDRIMIGMVGGFVPTLMNLVSYDFNNLSTDLDGAVALGYGVRGFVLCIIGGIIAFLHDTEKSRVKIFQLGIYGPALFVSWINASNLAPPPNMDEAAPQQSSFSLVTEAYASPMETAAIVSRVQTAGFWDKFKRGVTGSPRKHKSVKSNSSVNKKKPSNSKVKADVHKKKKRFKKRSKSK